jgi:hypothetical protein
MKLEQLHKSHLYHDSLRENTCYYRFIKQMDQAMCFKLLNYLVREIQVNNFRNPVLVLLMCKKKVSNETRTIK